MSLAWKVSDMMAQGLAANMVNSKSEFVGKQLEPWLIAATERAMAITEWPLQCACSHHGCASLSLARSGCLLTNAGCFLISFRRASDDASLLDASC